MKRFVFVAMLTACAAAQAASPGIVPDTYVEPPELFPGAFIQKVAVQDMCSAEGMFSKRETAILGGGASTSSEIERVSNYYSQNDYDLAEFQVLVSIIQFISKHPEMSPDQVEKTVTAQCFERAKNPRYYANLIPPAKN